MSDSNDIATQEILGKPLEGKEFEGALNHQDTEGAEADLKGRSRA